MNEYIKTISFAANQSDRWMFVASFSIETIATAI